MYPVFRKIVLAAMLVFTCSCVERFYPGADDTTTGLLVINAHLTDEQGVQFIEIARSSPLLDPKLEPEDGAYARLLREDGESREFLQGEQPSRYICDFDEAFLHTGAAYRLEVITADGERYESDFDILRPAPPIDSLYYTFEQDIDSESGHKYEGIRFYLDFTYDDDAYEFLRWELTETYEFHNPYLERAEIWESYWRRYELPDSLQQRVCYITRRLQDLYSMSTENLRKGNYVNKAFAFIPNIQDEQKLHYKYSMLVRQYSIGPEAFHYWNELRKTSQDQGFLFNSQPSLLTSNICNVDDKEEKVLGFFSMSGVHEKRSISGDDLSVLDQNPNPYYCLPVDRGPDFDMWGPVSYPTYYATATYDGATVTEPVNRHCIDCRFYEGSSAEAPDF